MGSNGRTVHSDADWILGEDEDAILLVHYMCPHKFAMSNAFVTIVCWKTPYLSERHTVRAYCGGCEKKVDNPLIASYILTRKINQ